MNLNKMYRAAGFSKELSRNNLCRLRWIDYFETVLKPAQKILLRGKCRKGSDILDSYIYNIKEWRKRNGKQV